MPLRRLTRYFAREIALAVPFDLAMSASRTLLAAQGFGSGGSVSSSGEVGVLKQVSGEAPVLVDVGGHTGEYTAAFLRLHPGGICHVFEPSERHFRLLETQLRGRKNVTLSQKALGAEAGERTLYKDAEVTGLASLTKRRVEHHGLSMDITEQVDVDTLDRIVEERGIVRIDLLKIDVEGHELDVLRGSRRALERGIVKLIQFEFGGCNLDTRTTFQDFFYLFRDVGFQVGVVQPTGRLQWLANYDEMLEQYRTTNFVARPAR